MNLFGWLRKGAKNTDATTSSGAAEAPAASPAAVPAGPAEPAMLAEPDLPGDDEAGEPAVDPFTAQSEAISALIGEIMNNPGYADGWDQLTVVLQIVGDASGDAGLLQVDAVQYFRDGGYAPMTLFRLPLYAAAARLGSALRGKQQEFSVVVLLHLLDTGEGLRVSSEMKWDEKGDPYRLDAHTWYPFVDAHNPFTS